MFNMIIVTCRSGQIYVTLPVHVFSYEYDKNYIKYNNIDKRVKLLMVPFVCFNLIVFFFTDCFTQVQKIHRMKNNYTSTIDKS